MSHKIFITGATGYVGRNLVRYFSAKGSQVVALQRSKIDLNHKIENVEFVQGDLFSKHLCELMKGCTCVIHTAADTDHTNQSHTQFQTNVTGTQAVIEAAKQAGIQVFIHLSTESVLATGNALKNITEDHPLPSSSVGNYSESKAQAEEIVRSATTEKFRTVIIRPRFVWGKDDTTALPQIIQSIENKEFAWISGGHYLTSTTHITNLCFGIEQAIQHGQSGQIYAITDSAPIEFRSFLTQLLATQHIAPPVKEVPRFVVRKIAKISDFLARISQGKIKGPVTFQQYSTSAVEVTLDISKAKKELKYTPIITLSEGLKEIQK